MIVTFGDITFATKIKASQYVKDLLSKIGFCKSVKEMQPTFYQLLLDVLQCHPQANSKLQNMIDLQIVRNPMNGKTPHIIAIYQDQSESSLSWKVCITPRSKNHNLRHALRKAINYQINRFKQSNDSTTCNICYQELTGESHVDHIIPFADLVKDFNNDWPHDLPTIFEKSQDGIGCMFSEEDEGYETAWRIYHETYATLQITCASCNLSKGYSQHG
jgi:5-methylcytosine-specific restriction endonuclease McrA